MYTRPFSVHSYTQRKEIENQREEEKKNIGTYTTQETRKEVAKEVKRTHFNLGSDKGQFPQSLSKETYQNFGVDDKGINNQQKKMSMINKRSNFVFGNDPSRMSETTSNQAYNQKQHLGDNKSGSFSANTLRKGNFRLGFNCDDNYETTAQSNFTNKNDEFKAAKPTSVKGDKQSNLTTMYGYGKPTYQTMNNSNFTEKDVSDSFKDKILMKERGKNLKSSNFSFGHFNNNGALKTLPADANQHSNKFHTDLAKQSQIARLRGQELKKSNFKFSDKNPSDSFKSMAQMQFDEEHMKGDNVALMNNQNKEVSKNLQNDLRSSHFNFGNVKGDNQSSSHNAHPKFSINPNEKDESARLAKKMQSANFILGDSKQSGIPLRSTYKDSISNNQNYQPVNRGNEFPDSKKTTVNIGKGKCYDYTSEAKDKFISQGQYN